MSTSSETDLDTNPEVYLQDENTTVYHGDCIELMHTLADASIDAIILTASPAAPTSRARARV